MTLFGQCFLLVLAIFMSGCSGASPDISSNNDDQDSPEEIITSPTKCISFAAQTIVTEQTKPVDVLWVLDNSFSMCDLQLKIAEGLKTLASALVSESLDGHMGYVTASMFTPGENGELQSKTTGAPKYITAFNQPSLDIFIENFIAAGCLGHPYELGGTAAITALDLSVPGGPNDGFLRDNATLAVILVSDEDDQSNASIIADPTNPYHYLYNSPDMVVQKLAAHKGGDVNRLTYNPIVHVNPDPNGATLDPCYDTEADAQGLAYTAAHTLLGAQKTNGKPAGFTADICTTTDYSPIVAQMINTTVETEIIEVTSIDLSGLGFKPEPSSITLKLSDGSLVLSGWHYNGTQIILDDPKLQQAKGTACAKPSAEF